MEVKEEVKQETERMQEANAEVEAAVSTGGSKSIVHEDVIQNLQQSEEEEAKRKLYVYNIGQRTRKEQVDTFLTSLNLDHLKIMKPPSQNYAIVTFKDADAATKAKTAMTGKLFEGYELDVQPVKPRKRKRADDNSGPNAKKGGKMDEKDLSNYLKVLLGSDYPRSVKDITTPLWEMPYEEQLKRKQDEMRKVLFKLWRKTRNEYWKKAKRDNHKLTKSSYFKMVTNDFEKTKMPEWLMRISPGAASSEIEKDDDSHPSNGKSDAGESPTVIICAFCPHLTP
jgi:RNA recognition motif-containing protein